MPRTKAGPSMVIARQREAAAVELRARGKSFSEIGRVLGVTKAGAYYAVTRAMDRRPAEAVDRLRAEVNEKLLAAEKPLLEKVKKGHLATIETWLKIIKEYCRVNGIYDERQPIVVSAGLQVILNSLPPDYAQAVHEAILQQGEPEGQEHEG